MQLKDIIGKTIKYANDGSAGMVITFTDNTYIIIVPELITYAGGMKYAALNYYDNKDIEIEKEKV